MATIQQHNQLIKVIFNGNRHLKHVLNNKEIEKMTIIENRFPLTKLPVCSSCEGLAVWSKGMQATCRKCGTITKNPITYSSYLASGYDIDQGHTAKEVLKYRANLATKYLPEYNMNPRKGGGDGAKIIINN